MPGVVVIGAGPGIGGSVARRFAREGLQVGLVARQQQTLDTVAASVRGLGVQVSIAMADVAQPELLIEALASLKSAHGVPDAVVYNAGLIQADGPGDLSADQQAHAWRVNVLGAITAAAATIPEMAERGSGTFLITGGMPVPVADYFSLSLGKAGVRALTAMLAERYGPMGVHAATVTITREVVTGTPFDSELIAEHYWRLHTQPRGEWESDFVFQGGM